MREEIQNSLLLSLLEELPLSLLPLTGSSTPPRGGFELSSLEDLSLLRFDLLFSLLESPLQSLRCWGYRLGRVIVRKG
jgi:hypothetical protein